MSFSHCYEIINRDRFFSSHRCYRPLEGLLSTSAKIRCRHIVLAGLVWPPRKAFLWNTFSPFPLSFPLSLHQVIFLFFVGPLICPSYNINYLKCPAFHKRPPWFCLCGEHTAQADPWGGPQSEMMAIAAMIKIIRSWEKGGTSVASVSLPTHVGSCLYFVLSPWVLPPVWRWRALLIDANCARNSTTAVLSVLSPPSPYQS